MHALGQQVHPLVEIGTKGARGKEAQRIIDHNRRLADLLGVIKGLGQRQITGLLAHDDLDQRHFVDGREEVDTDEVVGIGTGLSQLRNRER